MIFAQANDLALRMARAFTKKKGVIVLDGAYHGHTLATMEISPYKHRKDGCPTTTKPEFVEVAVQPDAYRGRQSAKAYAADVKAKVDALLERRRPDDETTGVAAMVVESIMSVAGVVVPPPTYLKAAFAIVRGSGGICICDEVQTGLGRAIHDEDKWYAFELHGVDPDIVTLGKPMGNGMPIAAVIATQKIADAFAHGPEYFNTFGGNPVCCAAALAVLDEVDAANLRQNAVLVGNHLRNRLTSRIHSDHNDLGKRPVVTIGDLRGAGLYLGIDLVTDFESRQPATNAANLLCSALVEKHHILTTLDGAGNNVLVVKPPLVFSIQDANFFLDALFTEMDHLATLPQPFLDHAIRTPT